mgnify:CR=1 FL=1
MDTSELSAYVFGKLPPQAVDVEEAVISAVLTSKDAISDTIGIITPESFYLQAHKIVYSAALRLHKNNNPVDLLTVTSELRKSGELDLVGGPYAISVLSDKVASAANLEYHCRIVAQKFIQRELIRVSSEVIKFSYEENTDVFELLDGALGQYSDLLGKIVSRKAEHIQTLMAQQVAWLHEMTQRPQGLIGIPSGFHKLDRVTGGWNKSDLIIIAGRPGAGKTSLALSMIKNTCIDFGTKVAFFSLEMSSRQLVSRLTSMSTHIPLYNLRNASLSAQDWEVVAGDKFTRLADTELYIDDTPALNVHEFGAKAKKLHHEKGIELFVVDYLQLMDSGLGKRSSREQQVATISRTLKLIAKSIDVPIIALSQLSRESEKRGNHKPQLSDLRDSGSIEQDADLVLFAYRPEIHGIMNREDGSSTKGYAELLLDKHRNGSLGVFPMHFNESSTYFNDWSDMDHSTSAHQTFRKYE